MPRPKGPWSEAQIELFLDASRVPLRLACNGASGHPLMASLWFVPLDGRLWCATPRSAAVAKRLARDPRCAFEVAQETPPYRGVRGQAIASLDDTRGEEILRTLVDRHLGGPESAFARWLLSRARQETAIALAPRTLLAWDFSERMGNRVASNPNESRTDERQET